MPKAAPKYDRSSPVWLPVIAALIAVALAVVARLRIVPIAGWGVAGLGLLATVVAAFITLIQHNTSAGDGWTWTYVYRCATCVAAGTWATWMVVARWTPWMVLGAVIGVVVLAAVGLAIPEPVDAPRYQQPTGPLDPPTGDRRHPVVREWEALIRQVTKMAVTVRDWRAWENPADGLRLFADLPVGVTTADLAAHADKLAHARRLPRGCAIRVEDGDLQGLVEIDVMLRNSLVDTRQLHCEPTTPASINDELPVLCTPRGQWHSICLRISSMVVGGTTGSGKTTLLHRIIMWLARCVDALVWVVDLNGGGVAEPWISPWAQGRTPRPVVDWVADDETEAAVMAAVAAAVARDRKTNQAAVRRKKAANSMVLPVDHTMPAIVVLTDEGGEVRQAVSLLGQLAGNGITRLAQIGRAEGVRVIMSVLRGTSDLTDKGLRVNAALRLCLRMEEHDEYEHVLGANPGKVQLSGAVGAGFLRTPDIPRPVLGSTLNIDLAGIDRHAVACGRLRPELDEHGLRAAARVSPQMVCGGREPAPEFMAHPAMRDAAAGVAYVGRWERYARKLAEMRGEDLPEEEPAAVTASPAAATSTVAASSGSSVLDAWAASVGTIVPTKPAPPVALVDGATIIQFPGQPAVVASAPDTAREQILALVRGAGPAGISASDIERGVTVGHSRVYGVMGQLRDDERVIVKNAAGLYVLAAVAKATSA